MVSTIFRKMVDIYNYRVDAWQRRFIGELFNAVLSLRGRVNFTNLARFSRFHKQTFRRNFGPCSEIVCANQGGDERGSDSLQVDRELADCDIAS